MKGFLSFIYALIQSMYCSRADTTLVVEGESCCVCLSSLVKGVGSRQLRCGHSFHSTCIERWFSCRRTCPLCRFCCDEEIGFRREDKLMEEMMMWFMAGY
ncbi:hypothetical protein QJS04_geneDACA001241 [Acorus gramineus]|uniref:RING-type E3 ubiquitin transferase n=1 Tax=Acorus gramineus TaxID=55184 RepID=A0AAV9ABF0_ACOGR|nr:hypothetical protein QJS04_geneDACA001241 [Acorus gramineus]